jgi:hypothetical protein
VNLLRPRVGKWLIVSCAALGCGRLDTGGLGESPDLPGDVALDEGTHDEASIEAGEDSIPDGPVVDTGEAVDSTDGTLPGDAPVDSTPDTTTVDTGTDTGSDTGVDVKPDADLCAPATGTAGQALLFSSSSKSYLEAATLTIPTDFTIEAWVSATTAGDQMIAAKDQSGVGANQFRFGLTGSKLYFIMTNSASVDGGLWKGSYALLSPSTIPLSTWSHLAVTKSGAAFALYVNGKSVATFTATASLVHTGTQPFRVGARNGSGTAVLDVLDGTIDEVRVWRIARSASEIACDMRRTLSPSHPQWASLVAYWKLDDGSGAVAADAKEAFAGTLVNAPKWVASGAF